MTTTETHRGSHPEPENTQIQTVTHDLFGQLRIITKGEELWFFAKEVAEILGYSDTDQAIRKHCLKAVESTGLTGLAGRQPKIIPESDLYLLVMRSGRDEAKVFQAWVTEEVLPSIRKTGGYHIQKAELTEDEIVYKALTIQQKKIEAAEAKIRELTPKAQFCDAVTDSPDLLTFTQVAKWLGMKSAQELTKWLHSQGIIYKQSKTWLPYSRYSQLGYFKIITHTEQVDGESRTFQHTKVTQAGKEFIFRRWNESSSLLQTPNTEN
jgi:prophage antirepressor-like protein